MVKSVGIDPGLAATGVGMVTGVGKTVASFSFGAIRTDKTDTEPRRLNRIFEKLLEVLRAERPDLLVIEAAFSLDRYPKSGILLGKVMGVALLAGCQVNVPVIEIPVREVKQALTGNGAAGKAQLERAVRNFLGTETPITPSHASDAMALALIGLLRFDELTGLRRRI